MWSSEVVEPRKTFCINYCRHGKNIIRKEGETETIYGNQGASLNDQTAAKTSIDFLVKYTTQLKIQLIKRQLQIAVADLDMLGKLGNVGPHVAVRELHDFTLTLSLITAVQWEIKPHKHYSFSMWKPIFLKVVTIFRCRCDAHRLQTTSNETTRWISALKA